MLQNLTRWLVQLFLTPKLNTSVALAGLIVLIAASVQKTLRSCAPSVH